MVECEDNGGLPTIARDRTWASAQMSGKKGILIGEYLVSFLLFIIKFVVSVGVR